MCKQLAILPIFSIIIAFSSPKQAFASHPKNIEQRLIFAVSSDLELESGSFSEKAEENEENIGLENSNMNSTVKKAENLESIQLKSKKAVCPQDSFEAGACKIFKVAVTGYSSTIDQCDSDPFTTASGKHVHPGTLAANFLPFGTLVKFPEYFGDRIFIVEDRMNKRFSNRMDIWFESRREALEFGKRTLTAVVVK